ncbi:hypothetical protein EYF80_046920 [Liparis tanakae]|uniref:Uncharacterized protein n=1 Tax=Liparis tanakae TaxID=230148 RepID=A0A4Z2FQ11_9TELE|nr:hypothetical protein EYF80_046920 [Liparis tanakae]
MKGWKIKDINVSSSEGGKVSNVLKAAAVTRRSRHTASTGHLVLLQRRLLRQLDALPDFGQGLVLLVLEGGAVSLQLAHLPFPRGLIPPNRLRLVSRRFESEGERNKKKKK